MLNIIVVTAGVSEPSTSSLLGEQLATASLQALKNLGEEAQVQTIALRSLAKPLMDFFSLGFPTGELAGALDSLRQADAVITVSPTFKASYAGLFKMFWDVVEDEDVQGKPVLLAATGGTARHSLMIDHAMRPLFSYLRMSIMPTSVFAATDDFGADKQLQARVDRAGAELAAFLAGGTGRRPAVSESKTARKEGEPLKQQADETLNAGSFFGIAGASASEETAGYKASGLPQLTVTPFEDLLKK